MRDFLKIVLSDPFFFILVISSLGVYSGLIFKYAGNKYLVAQTERIFLVFLLCSWTGVVFFPFTNFYAGSIFRGFAEKQSILAFSVLFPIGIILGCALFLNTRLSKFHIYLTDFFINNFSLTSLLLLFFLSCFWSIAPILTLFASALFCGVTFVAIYYSYHYDFDDLFNHLLVAFAILVIVSIFFSVIVHGGEPPWRGIYSHKNGLGRNACFASIIWSIAFLDKPNKVRNFIILSLMVLTLLFSMSTTSILIYLANLSFLGLSPFLRQKNPLAIYLSLTFVFGSILFVAGRLEAIASLFSKDLTLTGRASAIWPLLMEAISERPYFGYGYAAFWQNWLGSQDPSNNYVPSYQLTLDSAHNGVLELGLDIGLAGILVFLLLALKYIHISFKTFIRGRDYKSVFPICLLIFQVMSNTTESRLVSINAIGIYWLILIFILAQDFKNEKTFGKCL